MRAETETGVIVVLNPKRSSFLILNKTEHHTARHRRSQTSLPHRRAELNTRKTIRRLQVGLVNRIVLSPP